MGKNDSGEFKQLSVGDLMTTQVVVLEETTTLHEAVQTMVSREVRHLPVVRNKKPVAVLSDRDVRMKVSDLVKPEERRKYMVKTTVMAHASKPVTTASADMPVQEAAQIFVESRIGCLPVVDEAGRLIGIVTQTDLLKWLAQMTK
ncbi:MAG TPA: CBS domain-containing protein [Myxococcota bacterium]|nr:CBS domain-containing protein [Myxococcota bacterium]